MALVCPSQTMHKVEIGRLDGSQEKAPVYFRTMHNGISPKFVDIRREMRGGRLEICADCKKAFQPGDFLTMVLCNNVFFPNCFVHTRCVDWNRLAGLARSLQDSYAEALKYAHWF